MSHTQVILLESQQGVGKLGETVRVRSGFARNFLLPRNKALVANKANLAKVLADKAALEEASAAARKLAEAKALTLANHTLTLNRFASETGQLYGSLKAKDLAATLTEQGHGIAASQILLADAIKSIGTHTFRVVLHADVIIPITLTIQRQSL